MDNKKKLIISSGAVAGLAVVGGAFALFSDVVEQDVQGTVGTVNVDGEAEMKHTQVSRDSLALIMKNDEAQDVGIINNKFEEAPNNINPGDNLPVFESKDDLDNPDNIETVTRPGTDHEIDITIENKGTKSVVTRVMVELTGTAADGSALTKEQLRNIKLYFDKYNSVSGVTSIGIENVSDSQKLMLGEYERPDSENSIIYGFNADDAAEAVDMTTSEIQRKANLFNPTEDLIKSKMVLSGTGDNAEIEKYKDVDGIKDCPVTGKFKLDLAMKSDEYRYALEGATLNVTVKIEGMQYRNTSSANWETLFTETFVEEFE